MKHIGISLIHFKLSKDDWKAQRQLALLELAMLQAIDNAMKNDKELKDVRIATRNIVAVQELYK
jgi:hypothetical protein